MDALSVKLNQSGSGVAIGGHLINHLCYADGLCLISLSSAGMQSLLDLCSTYAIEHNVSKLIDHILGVIAIWCNCTVTAMIKLRISYNSLWRLLNIPKT